MLELQKKQIHMSRSKNTVSAQVTFDEDFNIPDAKPDVGSVLLKQADAVMEELRQLSEKVIIKGRLDFEILYAVEGSGRMKNLSGALTFEENVSYPGLEPGDYVRCRTKISVFVLSTQESFILVPCLARNFLLHQHSLRRQQDRFQGKKISLYLEKIWKWCLCSCKKRIRFVWRMM